MSNWIEIKDKTDIEYDDRKRQIDVCYSTDNFGNNYITIPVDFILQLLRDVNEIDDGMEMDLEL